jgi:hypothetical protein
MLLGHAAPLHVVDDADDLEARVAVAHETTNVIANRALGQVLPGEGVIDHYDLRRDGESSSGRKSRPAISRSPSART